MKKLLFTFLIFCGSFYQICAQSGAVADSAVADDEEYYDDSTVTQETAPKELEKPEFRKVSDDSINALKAKPEFAYMQYADSFFHRYQQPQQQQNQATGQREEEQVPSAPGLLDNPGFRGLYWGVAIAVVLWLLWSVFKGKGSLFARNKKQAIIEEETVEEDTTGKPLDMLIDKAVKAKDYRLAIRYLYLQTLEILGEKQLISLAPQKTNYQYLRELHDKPYASNFSTLTMQYEYVWYGEFKLDDNMFEKIHGGFKKFKSQVV